MLEVFTFVALFPVSLAALAATYALTVRRRGDDAVDGPAEAAFGLGQAAIFGLIALILGFSFAFAAERFEARRELVVSETVAVGRAYQAADFLPAAQRTTFRQILVAYTRTRLDLLANEPLGAADDAAAARSDALRERLWSIAVAAARNDPHDLLTRELTAAVDETGDVSEEQGAALANHVPGAILALVVFATLAGAVLLGLTFGRARSPNAVLSTVFCLLCAATVFTIVDLDDGSQGFIRLDTTPLRNALDAMSR